MLISSDEIHSITNQSESSNVIHVYIDCNTCYDRFSDFYEIVAISTYDESFKQLNQNKYIIIKNVYELAIALNNHSDSDVILEHFDALIKSIIICYRKPPNGMEVPVSNTDDDKMALIYRTIRYMYSNYDHKLNLQEISDAEYINLYHLSHSFKEITGYSFRDWLNFVRAEQAEKMMLETNLTLSEIAYKCGFSDVRYLNKHFQKWYKTTPNKYRNIFKPSYELVNSIREFQEDTPMDDVIVNLSTLAPAILETGHIEETIDLDLSDITTEGTLDMSWQDSIICNILWLMEKHNLNRLLSIRDDLGIKGIIVDDLFTVGMHYLDSTESEQIYDIIAFLLDKFRKVSILVSYNENYVYEVEGAKSFLNDYPLLDMKSGVNNLEFCISGADSDTINSSTYVKEFTELAKLYQIPVTLEQPKVLSISLKSNYINRMIAGEMKIDWFFSKNGFKNNIYYFHMFLASMYLDVVEQRDNYIISRKGNNYKILMFSDKTGDSSVTANYHINLHNIDNDYKYVKYHWDVNDDDTLNLIGDQRVIKHLSASEYNRLDMLSMPWAHFDYLSKEESEDGSITVNTDLSPSSLQLLELTAL